jgi:nitrogen fixation protein FixH
MNLDPVKRFLTRAKAAQASKATEVRMPVQEAQDLSLALAELMAQALHAQQAQAPEPTTVKVEVDGGGFR